MPFAFADRWKRMKNVWGTIPRWMKDVCGSLSQSPFNRICFIIINISKKVKNGARLHSTLFPVQQVTSEIARFQFRTLRKQCPL